MKVLLQCKYNLSKKYFYIDGLKLSPLCKCCEREENKDTRRNLRLFYNTLLQKADTIESIDVGAGLKL